MDLNKWRKVCFDIIYALSVACTLTCTTDRTVYTMKLFFGNAAVLSILVVPVY